jgi:hypothetical protein
MTDYRQEVLHRILEALQTPDIAQEIRAAWVRGEDPAAVAKRLAADMVARVVNEEQGEVKP